MILDLRQFDSFPADVSLDIEADKIDLEIESITFKDLVNVRLTIQKVKDEYFFQGYVTVPIQAECSRCLSLFDSELTGDITFVVKREDGKGVLSTDQGEDIVYLREGNNIIEMDEPISRALLLSIPMKHLCSSDCKGLCPSCGVNLNEETCDCKEQEIDERWEGLRDLLE